MDKIQAAIAKARAAREEGNGRPSGEKPRPHPRSPAQQSRILAKPVPEPPAERAQIWQPLATFAPPAKQMARHRIVSFDNSATKSPGTIEFDMLRTKILQQMRANDWTRLAITSPGAHCGKTTVALNLAFSFSRQPEICSIVAEMDMRRPSMAKTFGVSGDTGFASVIDGKADFADIAMRPRPNLALAMNYAPARNTSELLQSTKVGRVLFDIEETYKPDLIIFDTPPMLLSDDTMAFMGHVDCVLLVAAAESTSVGEIDTCERDLATQTNVLGVMLNKCRYMDKDTSY